ncbi:AIR synthase-related protein, partial [Thermodesulfobacteriota bacterium]
MVAMGGELGAEIHLERVPYKDDLSDTQLLYSESAGRFLVTIAPEKREAFERLFSGLATGRIGSVTESPLLRVGNRNGSWIIEEDVSLLKKCWKKTFGGLI